MHSRSIIRTCTSAVLLLIFSLSISPKQYWHDLFAQHEDLGYATEQTTTVRQAGFDCNCEDLVVGTPFIEWSPTISLLSVDSFVDQPVSYYRSFHRFIIQKKDLRGPPSVDDSSIDSLI